jgi:diaminohydroxyphosphoribosylaminopyrimidine deaminase/5-amino-6-(5-phosphoribosylamino)uracil reductase
MKVYSDRDLMKLSIDELLKSEDFPSVGAIIFKDGNILSTGFRGELASIHAERVAIEKLTDIELNGATLITTLEPCVNIKEKQSRDSCTELIIKSGISKVVIGVLDPNGAIYSQGYRHLLLNGIDVQFFDQDLRNTIEEETFRFDSFDKIIGPGRRRVPVVNSGTTLKIYFSESDIRFVELRWSTIQYSHGTVDLISGKGSVRLASGAREFEDITDPMVFRFPSHFARMSEGMIAIVKPLNSTISLLVKLNKIYEKNILFQWQFRNDK